MTAAPPSCGLGCHVRVTLFEVTSVTTGFCGGPGSCRDCETRGTEDVPVAKHKKQSQMWLPDYSIKGAFWSKDVWLHIEIISTMCFLKCQPFQSLIKSCVTEKNPCMLPFTVTVPLQLVSPVELDATQVYVPESVS